MFDWLAKLISQLGESCDLENWDEIGDYLRRGSSEYFVEIRMLCYMAPSHTNTHSVRGRTTAKKEIRSFQNWLVRELKVNEGKLLRQSDILLK